MKKDLYTLKHLFSTFHKILQTSQNNLIPLPESRHLPFKRS